MSRLPMLTRDQLNEAQRRLHENLVGGERAKAPRAAARRIGMRAMTNM